MLTDIRRKDETAQFFEHVFGHVPEGMWFYVWTLPNKVSHWFKSPTEAAAFVSQQHNEQDVYVGIALARSPGQANERIQAGQAAGIVGFVADVDYQHEVHNSKRHYPPDLDSAKSVTDAVPLAPSILVHSGHGLQAWWLFKEPWIFDSASERVNAQKLAEQWSATIKAYALRLGYALDSVHDLARVMRVPGTYNNKDEPVPVHTAKSNSVRYNPPLDFEEHLVGTDLPTTTTLAVEVELPLTLDSEAAPPQKKLAELRTTDNRFAATWHHQRKDLPDHSTSGYDMALANIAGQAGWQPQEIVDLIIAHRRHHGRDLKLRQDYYQRTAAKALATAGRNTASTEEAASGHSPSGDASHLSDMGNAARLTKHHGRDLHYCYVWGKWLAWNGRGWRVDAEAEVMQRAKDTIRAIYAEAARCNDEEQRKTLAKHGSKSENAARVHA